MQNKIDCICSYSNSKLHDLFAITNHTKAKYCAMHNIRFVAERLNEYSMHPAWYKIELLKTLMNEYNYILYIDADAGFIQYDCIDSLLNFSYDVNLCETYEGLNTGVFAIKTSDKSKHVLDLALTFYKEYETDVLHEQNALIRAMKETQLTINVVSDEYLNSSPCNMTDNTKILHIMGDMKNYVSVNNLLTMFNV